MEERQIRTGIDRFLDLVNAGKELKLSEASKKLGVPEATLEIWADILLKESLVEIGYDGFGKMVVRRSLVKRQESEGPITEPPKNAPPKIAEHKMSLRERLSGMKRKKGHVLLKKYSKIKKDAGVPRESGVVSRFLSIFKGRFKKPEQDTSAAGTKSHSNSLFRSRIATPAKESRTKSNTDERLDELSKQITALKTIPIKKSRLNRDADEDLDDLSKRIAELKKKTGS